MIHPDILSEVDDYFILKQLSNKDLRRLLWMKLKRLKNRLEDNDIDLSKKILSEINPYISSAILKGEKNIKLFVEKTKS